jgi:hypothetical protein
MPDAPATYSRNGAIKRHFVDFDGDGNVTKVGSMTQLVTRRAQRDEKSGELTIIEEPAQGKEIKGFGREVNEEELAKILADQANRDDALEAESVKQDKTNNGRNPIRE